MMLYRPNLDREKMGTWSPHQCWTTIFVHGHINTVNMQYQYKFAWFPPTYA